MSVRKTVQATAFNPERLLTLLIAPIVSEKATHIADRHNQVIFRVRPDATKGEVKAAVELMGVKEQIIFPEIEYDKIDALRGMNITIATTAKSDAEAKALLAAFKFPFKN